MAPSASSDRFDAVLGSGRGSDRADEPPEPALAAPLERLRAFVDWANQSQLTPFPAGLAVERVDGLRLRPLAGLAAAHPFRLSLELGRMRLYGTHRRHPGTAVFRVSAAHDDGRADEYVGLIVGCEQSHRWQLLLDDGRGR